MPAYFPPPESIGTFRYAQTPSEKESMCGMDAARLTNARHFQMFLNAGDSFGVVIIRNGWMADEYYTENVLTGTTFDIWSCTKSFVSMAYGCLMEDTEGLTLKSRVYDFLSGYEIPDPRRTEITIDQLLSMTSGIRGSAHGAIGMGVPYGKGAYEYALGLSENRSGLMCGQLISDPCTAFDYSDANYTLLSLLFYCITGEDMQAYLERKLFSRIGIESFSWDMQGGWGCIGPYTNGHTGLHISTRDLARVGYLLLRDGVWEQESILPAGYIAQAGVASQSINPGYGLGFWTNNKKRFLPDVPEDMYFMKGYRSNRCYIIPSLDLVVARCGTGPTNWDDGKLIGEIVEAIIA